MRYCIQSDDEETLFGPERGCAGFRQRVLTYDGPSGRQEPVDGDDVLYVLRGSGAATVDGNRVELRPGTALYLAESLGWSVDEAGEATAGRQFRLLAPCPSVTQFVGYIPPGRAPDHYHRYDEVVYVLEGEGALHIDGDSEPLRRGSCIHLPAKLVHSLENHGPSEMLVLGVFRPAGSPAEAYYVDGTPAYQY